MENEPPVLIEPSVLFELPILNEPFLRNVSMKFREQKRKPFINSLKFRAHLIWAAQIICAAHFPHPGIIL